MSQTSNQRRIDRDRISLRHKVPIIYNIVLNDLE